MLCYILLYYITLYYMISYTHLCADVLTEAIIHTYIVFSNTMYVCVYIYIYTATLRNF